MTEKPAGVLRRPTSVRAREAPWAARPSGGPKIGLINKFLIYVFGLSQAPLAIDNVWGVAFVQGLMLTPTMVAQ